MEISTFNDTDEAITKIRGGSVNYDLYFPSYDQISRLVSGKLVQPLNHSYIPNIKNVWPSFTNPWYDQDWRYSVPYTIYTTGIGWRNDQVPADVAGMKNPYDVLWDPAVQGQDRRHRRLAHRHVDGASAPRHYRRQHVVGGRPEGRR